MLTYEDITKPQKYKDFSQVPLELATLYAAADSYQTLRLVTIIQEAFALDKKKEALYKSIEHPLIDVLYEMEKKGVNLDASLLYALNEKLLPTYRLLKQKFQQLLAKKLLI